MEHIVHLGATNIVQVIAPTPASTLMKKIKEALQGRDKFDSLTQDVDALLQAAERGGLENNLDAKSWMSVQLVMLWGQR
jgi:hypothetical protein